MNNSGSKRDHSRTSHKSRKSAKKEKSGHSQADSPKSGKSKKSRKSSKSKTKHSKSQNKSGPSTGKAPVAKDAFQQHSGDYFCSDSQSEMYSEKSIKVVVPKERDKCSSYQSDIFDKRYAKKGYSVSLSN